MSRHSTSITVDFDDFDDAAILEAAAEIRGRRSMSSPLDDGTASPAENLAALIADLSSAIARGDQAEARLALEAMVRGDRGLIEAVDLGWRRGRR